MTRMRAIKPGFFLNEDLADVPPLGRLLFAGLWCLADRAGRLEDRPRRIKSQLLPYDDADIDVLLDALAAHGFILRYEVAGEHYIQVVNFTKHQTPHIRENASTIPAPDMHGASTVPAPSLTLTRTDPLALTLPTMIDPGVCVYSADEQTAKPPPGEAPPDAVSTHTPIKKTAEKPPGQPARKPDVLWQVLLSSDGFGRTPAHKGEEREWRAGLAELARASPDGALRSEELTLRLRRYRERYTTNKQTGEPIPLTMRALVRNWGMLGEEQQTRGPTTISQQPTTKRKAESPQERFARESAEMEAGYKAIVARQQQQLAASGKAGALPGLPGARAGPGEAMARPAIR